ncbi:hypothetical protein ABUL39_13020 [Rhodothermus marinus]|uniref:hypothetical protein n=1 Tax=Rhodothermus marinus TaxID=29549 RepID=UPI0037C50EE8
MPRKTKCTPLTIRRIAELVALGAPPGVAARAVGISPKTLSNWRWQGARDLESGAKTPYARLVEAIEQAEATLYLRAVRAISEALDLGDAKVAMWVLERLDPERWSKPVVIDVRATREDIQRLSDEELDALAQRLGIMDEIRFEPNGDAEPDA